MKRKQIDLLLSNARVIGRDGLQQVGISAGKIVAIAPQVTTHQVSRIIDFHGDWLSLGGVDLQINGGLGLAFPDLTPIDLPKLQKICDFLYAQGVDIFLPTIVTTSIPKIEQSLATIAQFMATQDRLTATAKIYGVHLEGPFLNWQKRGAHPEQYLLPLTPENIRRVLGDYSQIVRIITLAPELDPEGKTITELRKRNIIVSLGHSLATAQQAQHAFELGASMVTHAFNAMPGLHHRQPGLLGAAIVHPNVYCGLIADGNHVSPIMSEILLKAKGGDRGVFLVSDALAPLGLGDGIYPWDEREITVTAGTARLADGTLSGTTLPLLTGVQNLVKWGCQPATAIALATEAPRKTLNLPGMAIPQTANLLRWYWDKTKQLAWTRIILDS